MLLSPHRVRETHRSRISRWIVQNFQISKPANTVWKLFPASAYRGLSPSLLRGFVSGPHWGLPSPSLPGLSPPNEISGAATTKRPVGINRICAVYGELAQVVERSLSIREVTGAMPFCPYFNFHVTWEQIRSISLCRLNNWIIKNNIEHFIDQRALARSWYGFLAVSPHVNCHKPSGRLLLLSANPTVTFPTKQQGLGKYTLY